MIPAVHMGQKATKARLGVFHHSVRNGNIEKVKELLEEGVMLEDQDDVFGIFPPSKFDNV